MIPLRLLLLTVSACLTLAASNVHEQLDRLLALKLDPAACYRVRDLFLERDDVKLYFTDGYLIFAEALEGREAAALFLADKPTDQGEILVIPPNPQERESLSRHIGDAVLNHKFRSALLLSSDDTARVLHQAIAESSSAKLDPTKGDALAKSWSPVLKNIIEGVAVRLLADLTSDIPEKEGFFAAAIGGGPKGRFDVIVDPRAQEQVWVGQVTFRDGRRRYETWCEFEGRTFREGLRAPVDFGANVERYRIEANLLDDLSMQVTAALDMVIDSEGRRSLPFDISKQLEVTAARVNGASAEFLQLSPTASDGDRRQNTLVLLELPQQFDRGEKLKVELDYRGRVITKAGNGVYFVGSRGNWYPRGRFEFSRYELTFHHPADLEVVATGELIERTEEAGRRTSRFRAEQPLRFAGFNLGSFVSTTREVEGRRLEVRANRLAEERLQAPKAPIVMVDPGSLGRPRISRGAPLIVKPEPPPIRPSERIEEVADEAADTLRFLIDKLGPPPTSVIAVTPIPGFFGQGFPGLVYASTLSYLDDRKPPLSAMSEANRFFYRRMLLPHELSHQWWGNLVSIDNLADAWTMEALATYTSLLYIEDKFGRAELEKILGWYRDDLLRESDSGEAVDEAGPIAMGERLRDAKAESAYQIIVYEKGAWVFHMLRSAMGDDAFGRFLRALTERFAFQSLTDAKLRRAAQEFLPEGYPDKELRDFFDQWVYHTGIPRFSASWKQQRNQLEITLRQRGVPENFTYSVPIEIGLADGSTLEKIVVTEGEKTVVQVNVSARANAVKVDPGRRLLAVIEGT